MSTSKTPKTPKNASAKTAGAKSAGATAATTPATPTEDHWGDPHRSQPRTDTSRGERIAGITWLSIGILFGLFVEVLYLGSRLTIGDTSIPVPWTILFAFFFNRAITRTALLWTRALPIQVIPAALWLLGFFILIAWPALPFGGDTFLPSSPSTMLLLGAGFAGSIWPVRRWLQNTLTPLPASENRPR